jgi:Na+/melibiose symporter-like transporter
MLSAGLHFFDLQWLMLRQSPNIQTEDNGYGLRELGLALKAIIKNKPFLSFIVISLIFHIGWFMSWPLFFLLQVDYMQANESWLSYVIVTGSLLQWLTVGHWSRFIERRGIRLALVVGAVGLTINRRWQFCRAISRSAGACRRCWLLT